mmetsp:Transcript_1337/g.2161  ORF Transcript_1337/g.2161 Transcript_1337/m.2161 type:complete len:200 (-) Transcript_1337:36-635(-)
MEAKDIEEREQSNALCKAANEHLPLDVLRIIWDFHYASTHHRAWGRVKKELTSKKPILGRIMFNSWYGMTLVDDNEQYARLKYSYAERDYSSGSGGKTHMSFYRTMDNTLLRKGKAVTEEIQGFYPGQAMYEAFSVPRVYHEKWSRIETIYKMHTQLLRYYDYWIDGVENNDDGKRKRKKKKNKHKSIRERRQHGRFST